MNYKFLWSTRFARRIFFLLCWLTIVMVKGDQTGQQEEFLHACQKICQYQQQTAPGERVGAGIDVGFFIK